MEKKLDRFEIGESGIVKNVLGDGRMRRRLFDMGVTPGARISMVKKAPLGDPIEITIRNYELTLRKIEASLVVMEVSK
ncbi:MAG: ferrous iron transport protein A [Clostridia bacterium]|nr:ferrous iron transport protein A [Clostridia bacterium]